MTIRYQHVDAFTDRPFAGNPAGVCLMTQDAPEGWMQKVARELGFSETAFVCRRADRDFALRWFTPAAEVDLCGHATLATAHTLWELGELEDAAAARFHTKSGLLTATKHGDWIELDFPASRTDPAEPPAGLLGALHLPAVSVGKTRFDYLVEVMDERAVRAATPDFDALRDLRVRGVMITARSDSPDADFVSRFFAPSIGVNEDPVTGSSHTALAPYWAAKLGKDELVGYQASARGGTVRCRVTGDRVMLSGHAVTLVRGEWLAARIGVQV